MRSPVIVAAAVALAAAIGAPAVAAPPSSERVMFTRGVQLVTAALDGTDVQPVALPDDGFSRSGSDWSADGKRVAYTKPYAYPYPCHEDCPAPEDVFVFDIAKGTETKVATISTPRPWWLRWSPDGRQIAYSATTTETSTGGVTASSGYGVGVLDVRTGAHRLVAEGNSPTWSPDGKRLAFNCDEQLCTVDADGSNAAVVPGSARMQSADWSPDGSALLAGRSAAYYTSLGAEVVVVTLDGAVRTVISDAFNGRWAPDGSIAFERFATIEVAGGVCIPGPCETTWGFWMMDGDGANQRQVTQGQYDHSPQFAR